MMMEVSQSLTVGLNLYETIIGLKNMQNEPTKSLNKNASLLNASDPLSRLTDLGEE